MEKLKLGFAREDFTPDIPVRMNSQCTSREVWHKIYATALYFQEEQEKAIADRIGVVFGDDKKREEKLAKAELQSERIAGITSKVEGFGESLFSEADEYANSAVTNSEFGAMVAADERRQSMLDGFGAAVASAAEEPAAPKSEFAALVGEPAKTTE